MKISYNGIQVKETRINDISAGECFSFEGWFYMKIRLNGKGISGETITQCAAVNLKSGTTRLIEAFEVVTPLTAKVQLRDRVMHYATGEEDGSA